MAIFSVIIPLFNKEKEISETLESVFAQDFQDFEIILVNDGSTDQSAAIVKTFTDPRLRYFETENNGVSSARNFGIEKASAELIVFLDADDFWFPDHLKRLHQLHQDFPNCGIYATAYDYFYRTDAVLKPVFKTLEENHFGLVPDFFKSSVVHRIAWTSAVMVPKKVLETTGNFNPEITYGEDLDLWIRIALRYPVAFDSKISARHHLGASNRISHSKTLKNTFPDFKEFASAEKQNPSLKAFLDQYRLEFGLKHKIAGDAATAKRYFSGLDRGKVSKKTGLLIALPAALLRILFKGKKVLEKRGIVLNPYH